MVKLVHLRVNVKKIPNEAEEMEAKEDRFIEKFRKEFKKRKIDPIVVASYGVIPEGNFKEIEIEVFDIQ